MLLFFRNDEDDKRRLTQVRLIKIIAKDKCAISSSRTIKKVNDFLANNLCFYCFCFENEFFASSACINYFTGDILDTFNGGVGYIRQVKGEIHFTKVTSKGVIVKDCLASPFSSTPLSPIGLDTTTHKLLYHGQSGGGGGGTTMIAIQIPEHCCRVCFGTECGCGARGICSHISFEISGRSIPHLCPFCNIFYGSFRELRYHLQCTHGINYYPTLIQMCQLRDEAHDRAVNLFPSLKTVQDFLSTVQVVPLYKLSKEKSLANVLDGQFCRKPDEAIEGPLKRKRVVHVSTRHEQQNIKEKTERNVDQWLESIEEDR